MQSPIKYFYSFSFVLNVMQVELLGYYGGDETHARSAWQCTDKEYDPKKMPGLLRHLAENEHHTPFEKSMLHFSVRCDYATHQHFLKHRIGVSINTESARFHKLKKNFEVPEELNGVFMEDTCQSVKQWYVQKMNRAYDDYEELLSIMKQRVNPTISDKRAREIARNLVPMGTHIDMDISFNFRSFVHFLKLRNSPDAQKEIQKIAKRMLQLVKDLPQFEHSLKAFKY
jgi:flavin-dependent thymidylate synthase